MFRNQISEKNKEYMVKKMGKKYKVNVPYICTVTVEVEIDDDDIEVLRDSFDEEDDDLFNDELYEMVREKAAEKVDVHSFCGNGDGDKLIGVYKGSITPDGIYWDEESLVEEI